MKALLALVLVSCGGGDDGMQMCGADHCGLQGHTIVKWTLDAYPDLKFPMDSCVDFNVAKVEVDAVSELDGTVAATMTEDCGVAQVTFDGLPAGTYTMFVDMKDINLASVLNAPVTMTGVTAGAYQNDTTATVNVPWTSWVGSFVGTFLYRLSWLGQGCGTAVPPVVSQQVTLMTNGGTIVMTDDGETLDGTAFSCYDLGQNFPQSAKNVPFGPATLIVKGYDAAAALQFSQSIDTFIGAGITNPTITYDIQPIMTAK